MQLITLAITLATASLALAQELPSASPSADPSSAAAQPAASAGTPGEIDLGPHDGPDGWMGPESPYMPPGGGDPSCWYLRQNGEWINVCSKSGPAYSQTVVPPQPYTTYSSATPTITYKTHPHIWHQRPQKPKATWTATDVPIWW